MQSCNVLLMGADVFRSLPPSACRVHLGQRFSHNYKCRRKREEKRRDETRRDEVNQRTERVTFHNSKVSITQ